MTTERRTQVGHEVEAALGEVLAHVRGEVDLPCRIVDDPAAERILALRKRMKLSRQKFADRFGLDARAVQEWEQGRRIPDRAARVLLTRHRSLTHRGKITPCASIISQESEVRGACRNEVLNDEARKSWEQYC